MDVAGLIIGIASLYTACRDCYEFYTTVSGAETESSAHLRELQIQQSILKAWGFHWQIQNEDNSEPEHTRRKHTKLHQYLSSNRFKVEGIFKSLSALADTLSNQERLTKRYGIQLYPVHAIKDGLQVTNDVHLIIPDATIEHVKPVVSEVRNRLSVMTKLKWALKDKEKFKKLITELRLHSESLYRLCSENAFESMNIYLTLECLARQESPAGLKWTSKLATQHAEVDEGSLVRKGYELLATTATLKALYYQDASSEEAEDDESIERERPTDRRLRALIGNFFNTFQDANMMKSVYGMIDHTEGEHKGHCSILYKLPGTIGVPSRERPPENLKLRAPVTLKSLLTNRQIQGIRCSLGARFELARKLVRAVCLLHSSGWLHKNIRAESVMFFPENINALHEDGYEIKIEIDVSKPSLMGYIFSRPDDIIMREDPPLKPSNHRVEDPHDLPNPEVPSHHTLMWDVPIDRNAQPLARRTRRRNASIYGRNMLGRIDSNDETKETNISGFTLDYYQHPAKHADPTRLYRHAYDVYSLGILLIEIGLWENVNDSRYPNWDDREEDYYERRTWICKQYLDRVRWQCGDTYADVVLGCLMIDSSDDGIAKASERELCVKIIADLENCQA
ncbi:unnamed protein product [Fusarium equiseti]|uniref:Prion-inhibition and propagation HeLo domain-containing protein n=1 Tax=Fusarium equiseti TaxID=61235 RepID=A0A8J2NLJ0_FUSEQ|nr:unnamed protein product [Fusarium equiseti]